VVGLLAVLVAWVPAAAVGGATPGRYIVVLDPSAIDPGRIGTQLSSRFGGQLGFVYSRALRGFSVQLDQDRAAALAAVPGVRYVVPDGSVSANSSPTPNPDQSQIVPFPLQRIDADKSSTASGDGVGQVNVNVAILDSGIDVGHHDLNVAGGINCANPQSKPSDYGDAFGHGTMVAGVVAAKDNSIGVVGVAPGARLWAVRVLNDKGNGVDSNILCGIDWVTATRTDADPSNDIAVANMSLGGAAKVPDDGHCGTTAKKIDPIHQAICASVAAGVTYVASAGNESDDIQAHQPADYDEVLTATAIGDTDGRPGGVGPASPCIASQIDDAPAGFSNFATLAGDVAHTVAAPGVCVASTYGDAKIENGVGSASGTSFAAPMVTGTVALCISSGACASLSPTQIVQKIVSDAATYNTANPGYGFSGDPLHSPDPSKSYGYLVRPAQY
jgi:subtilisin family serine protease